MNYRELGRTGWKVSEISFGAWAIGSAWGQVDDTESLAALHRAVDLGVNLFDMADVYGDGRSERLIGVYGRSVPSRFTWRPRPAGDWSRIRPKVITQRTLRGLLIGA